ncbi:MAG: hypothetical protein AAFV85_26770 [Cyanobacteria bacterium J06634_6]
MNDYTAIFSATAHAERFVKAHTANATTYALIAAVVILTAIKAVIDFAAAHLERAPEYRLRLQLASVKTQRWAVRRAIAVAEFDAYNGVTAKVRKLYASAPKLATKAIDKVFCLA